MANPASDLDPDDDEAAALDLSDENESEIISFKSAEEIEKSIVDSPFRAIYQTNNF
jgi:hypothetical protein